ncbi:unnamed protein product [Penicillium manginii]
MNSIISTVGGNEFLFYGLYLLSFFYVGFLVFVGSLIFYRLVLSPLAKFPGPRLAAATRLYETYFQIIKGGTFTWHIDRLHEQYGPVVRITPWEIHIKDPDYYGTIYAGPGKHRNKDPWFSFISFPESIFSTNGHELHRARRRILGQFFKKNAIQEFEPVIRENVESLCAHFLGAAECNRSLELHAAFYSFTCDTISQYAFGRHSGFRYLKEPLLLATWKIRLTSIFEFSRVTRHFPVVSHIAHLFPTIASWLAPQFGHVYRMEQDVKHQVENVLHQHRRLDVKSNSKFHFMQNQSSIITSRAIYPTILADKEVPQSEKSLKRLQDDAIFLMIAGTDAPSQALAITIFHILNNPKVCEKLKYELFSRKPDIKSPATIAELEKLPYLSSVIREGLRISSVVTTRLPRSAPDEILQYHQWQIPAGTYVSMSTYFILRDPKIFPDPTNFEPERWLLPREKLRELERYLVPASKGTLGCLGQNMASAWMYLVIGTLFRRFNLSLHDTTERNVEMTRDNFIGQTDRGMNVVQVKVLEKYSH